MPTHSISGTFTQVVNKRPSGKNTRLLPFPSHSVVRRLIPPFFEPLQDECVRESLNPIILLGPNGSVAVGVSVGLEQDD